MCFSLAILVQLSPPFLHNQQERGQPTTVICLTAIQVLWGFFTRRQIKLLQPFSAFLKGTNNNSQQLLELLPYEEDGKGERSCHI